MTDKKLPKANRLYQARIDKATFQPDVTITFKGTPKVVDKLTLIFKLLDTKEDNDGEYEFSVFQFYNLTPNVHFERDGAKSLTKAGQMLQNLFGEVPFPLKTREVDWEALQGCYATVFVNHKAPNTAGNVYPQIVTMAEPEGEEHLEVNTSRKPLIYKEHS